MPNLGSKELNQLAKARKIADCCMMSLSCSANQLKRFTEENWGRLQIVSLITRHSQEIAVSDEVKAMAIMLLEDREAAIKWDRLHAPLTLTDRKPRSLRSPRSV